MKKKILSFFAVITFISFGTYSVCVSQKNAKLSNLALTNVEALASGEVIIGTICVATCTYCWCGYFPEDYWADGEPYQ